MDKIFEKVKETSEFINSKIKENPKLGIVLGSGLGPLVDDMKNSIEIDYKDITNFPVSTVEGHAGKLVYGELAGKKVLAMKGRFHHYEGYEVNDVVFAIRVFKLLGIENILVTNAAGGINKEFRPGDIMIIKDHISLFAPSPLRGKNINEFGPRFFDMSKAYDRDLIKIAKDSAIAQGIEVKEGVYVFAQGPMYETPAEIKLFATLGADAVGMSTVPEVITARHMGIKVLGISLITNMAAGILDQPLNHEEVMATAKVAEKNFTLLVNRIIGSLSL